MKGRRRRIADEPLPEPDVDDIDTCERCGKPLGSTKEVDALNFVVCRTCYEDRKGDEDE